MARLTLREQDHITALRDFWLRQYTSAVLSAFPNPKPMIRTLRTIGGLAHNRMASLLPTTSSIFLGTQRYDVRTLKYSTPTASFSETVLVYVGLSDREALELLVKLSLPALPVVPTFKSFPIDDSTAVNVIRYDRKLAILEVDLAGGGVYRYENVSSTLASEFLFADSKGEFFNSRIKGKFVSQKIS